MVDDQPFDQTEKSEASLPLRMEIALSPARMAYVVIAANVLVFLLDQLSRRLLLRLGALAPVLVVGYGQWWRILASGFLHADVLHIAFNMYALYNLGRLLERFWGLWRFILVYLLSMLGSSACVMLFSALERPTVGASGALMGILGAQVIFFWRYSSILAGGRAYLNQLIYLAVVNIAIGLLPGISLWGHLGGLIAGALAGLALLPRYQPIPGSPWRLRAASISTADLGRAGLVILGEAVAYALAFIVRG